MNNDINIAKVRANCFRQSKVAGEFMFQMRVPGGIIDSKHLTLVQEIAQTYGNGRVHFGTRQTFSIPGILYKDMDNVNKLVKKYIEEVEVKNCGVDMEDTDNGYPTIGARNIMGCIGAEHCIKANAKVSPLAAKIEKIIFPSNYHIKIAIAGCPNDCVKAHMTDFGIVGLTIPQYDESRCIECGACVRACAHHSTEALSIIDGKVVKNEGLCIGCGECVEACPTRAFSRSKEPLYRVLIGGRTSKKTPRAGKIFLDFVTEDVIKQVLGNWEEFSANTLDYKPQYLHGGHLIDKAGYNKFKEMMLKDVVLNDEARVATRINWSETEYKANISVKKVK